MTEGAFAAIMMDLVSGTPKILLLLRTDSPEWNLPGGRALEGETSEITVIRETKEETELDVIPLRQIGGDHKMTNDEGEVIDIARLFLCRVVGGELKNTTESKQQGWFSLSDLDKIKIVKRATKDYPEGRTIAMIKDALKEYA